MNRGSLPQHLPRVEMVVDIDGHVCPCCGEALHRIGEDVSERLDIVPAQLRVLIVRRPKYACRASMSSCLGRIPPTRPDAWPENAAYISSMIPGIRHRSSSRRE
jgi:transposase